MLLAVEGLPSVSLFFGEAPSVDEAAALLLDGELPEAPSLNGAGFGRLVKGVYREFMWYIGSY